MGYGSCPRLRVHASGAPPAEVRGLGVRRLVESCGGVGPSGFLVLQEVVRGMPGGIGAADADSTTAKRQFQCVAGGEAALRVGLELAGGF